MKMFFVLRSWFLVLRSSRIVRLLSVWRAFVQTAAADEKPSTRTKNQEPKSPSARSRQVPSVGKGALLQGRTRVRGSCEPPRQHPRGGHGQFYRNDPHPFAMLPYGIVRYHGAPADLRDIPLGTVMHVRAFLPPDPKTSAVPVLPVDSKTKDAEHYRGTGIFPAENHVLLLEDEPSHCLREGLVWKLKEVEIKNREGMITRHPRTQAGRRRQGQRGKDDLRLRHPHLARQRMPRGCRMIAEGTGPPRGRNRSAASPSSSASLGSPRPMACFTRFHISDIWLDDTAMQRAAHHQTETHKAFIRSRWMPAWMMPSSMASSVAPPSPRPFSAAWMPLFTPTSERRVRHNEWSREHLEAHRRPLRPRAHGLEWPHHRRHQGPRRSPARQQRHPDPIRDRPHHRRHPPHSRRPGPPCQLAARKCPARNTSTAATSKSASRRRPSSRNIDAPRSWWLIPGSS